MLARVALSLVFAGALADEEQCTNVGQKTGNDPWGIPCGNDSQCLGDKYKKIANKNVYDCADLCSTDPKCVQWTHEPTFLAGLACSSGFCGMVEKGGTCYLSSIVTSDENCNGGQLKYGACCGMKPPAPTPAPTPVPSPPAPAPVPGAQHHWAVIMAGSNSYGNYRHQADACHAYHTAKKNGVPESNIILLAYDDIANNEQNPFKGKIFNKPDGPDVYEGCNISYKGAQVTKDNFLKVLTGDTSAPGPVLKSTSKDRIFVYYADHGGVGILGVPTGAAGGYIHATEVNQALQQMYASGMYAEVLFYVEACESGSIFKGLLTAPNVLAVTAANAHQSSWAYYCAPMDKVHGKSIGSCLGDEFSIRWMEDADVANFKTETVDQQITKVTHMVRRSQVQHFGDMSAIGAEVIGDFEGKEAIPAGLKANTSTFLADSEDNSESAVNARDAEVHLAWYQMKRAETIQQRMAAQTQLTATLSRRQAADDKFMEIAVLAMDGDKSKAQSMIDGLFDSIANVDCHFRALQIVAENCGAFDDYTMRYSRLFANLCDANLHDFTIARIKQSVLKVCNHKPVLVI